MSSSRVGTKRGKYSSVSDEIRKLICSLVDSDATSKEISDITNVPYRTVLSIVKVYKSSGRVEKNREHHHRPKMSDSIVT